MAERDQRTAEEKFENRTINSTITLEQHLLVQYLAISLHGNVVKAKQVWKERVLNLCFLWQAVGGHWLLKPIKTCPYVLFVNYDLISFKFDDTIKSIELQTKWWASLPLPLTGSHVTYVHLLPVIVWSQFVCFFPLTKTWFHIFM